jgi:amidase
VPDASSIAFAGAVRLTAMLRAGEIAPRELVELYLERIDRIDPHLNAFRKVLAERALAEADEAAARLREGDDRPLLGLPVAIKDEMGVQGEVRTDGSNAYGEPEPEDWEIVRRLRAAGAIVIGITTVPELTIWPWTETATFGITRNPWDLQRTPGGSSGGSAAAVAAGLVPLATGSDGGGSIRIPAACCGLVGLKPQRGRIPYAPLPEHWHGLSVLGFVARSVEDAALAYEAVTGEQYADAARREPGALRLALSLEVPPGIVAKVDPEVRRGVLEVADALRGLGHDVVERDPDYGNAGMSFVARYLRGIHDDAAAMPHPERLEPRTKGMARMGRVLGQRSLDRAQRGLPEDARRINALFDDVDALLTPSVATLPIAVGRYTGAGALRSFNGAARFAPFTGVWNHVGNPVIAVPAGMSGEVPLSAQLIGPPDGEGALLSVAAQLERARPWGDRIPAVASA